MATPFFYLQRQTKLTSMQVLKINYFTLFVLFISFIGFSQQDTTYEVKDHYTKKEVDIVMRDGTKLHTTIYSPKDTSKKYPILMQRTPYSSRPYGEGQF